MPDLLPDKPTLERVAETARGCKACDLYKRGTQTVFGEGPKRARLMLVGEQPGDVEDLAGHPFVGPAGKLLDRALEQAGIDRKAVYVTNDDDSRRQEMEWFVADLRRLAGALGRPTKTG